MSYLVIKSLEKYIKMKCVVYTYIENKTIIIIFKMCVDFSWCLGCMRGVRHLLIHEIGNSFHMTLSASNIKHIMFTKVCINICFI